MGIGAVLSAAANAYLIIDAILKVTNYFKNRGKNDTFTTGRHFGDLGTFWHQFSTQLVRFG